MKAELRTHRSLVYIKCDTVVFDVRNSSTIIAYSSINQKHVAKP